MKDQLYNLLKKNRLIPIYRREEDTIYLVGYQRKPSSGKCSAFLILTDLGGMLDMWLNT